jgi:NADH dehydrogenase
LENRDMAAQFVTVFGGTGFLGRRIVSHLRAAGFDVRAASRHPERGRTLFPVNDSGIARLHADINEDSSVAAAVAGAFAVVNAISLYIERGRHTFHSVHVRAAERVAMFASRAGAERFVHISGIGADARSASPYIRSRGEGEAAVLQAFLSATLVRPAVMFGPDDAFILPLLTMLRRLPALPMFGTGETRLQPAYVEDVAEAAGRILQAPTPHRTYELAGPRIYTYQELLRTIAAGAGRQPLLVPFPFPLWRAIGHVAEFLPSPPITANQVDLMELDNVATSDAPGFDALQIVPHSVEKMLPAILENLEKAEKPSARTD